MTRREVLRLLGLAGLSVAGCADDEDPGHTDDPMNPFRCIGNLDKAVTGSVGSAPPELRRYEKIVILMMENRSFDHYFGHLSMPKSLGGEGRSDVDGLKGNEVQYLQRDGGREAFRLLYAGGDYKLGDIAHEWDDCHGQFNNGAMDGFIKMHAEELERIKQGKAKCGGSTFQEKCARLGDAMAYYKRQDTPVLHALFDNYALCDRWFSSVMGPTWPNRFYLHAATSCGVKDNSKMSVSDEPSGPNKARTIWHELRAKCISAVNYSISGVTSGRPSSGSGRQPTPAREAVGHDLRGDGISGEADLLDVRDAAVRAVRERRHARASLRHSATVAVVALTARVVNRVPQRGPELRNLR